MDNYEDLNFKIPQESEDYKDCSSFVLENIQKIMQEAMDSGQNKILINTNLKLGILMENVNKIAGPFIEAWAFEVFKDVLEDVNNKYHLINVEAGERLNMADIVLQFQFSRNRQTSLTSYLDVKATSEDIIGSGKSPNITSFARIRSTYIEDPDYIFIILSVKHKVYSKKDEVLKMMIGVMEIVNFNAYDLKYVSTPDISLNPALGTGQLQIRDINYVTLQERNAWEFRQILDKKFIASKKGFAEWQKLAKKFAWVKYE